MNEPILEYPKDYIDSILCGDHLDLLPQIPDGSIDLTVTSPPYDNLRTYQGYTFDFPAIAAELYRVTKDGGVVVWVVGDATINGSETGTSFRQALGFMDIGFRLHDTMIWQKLNPVPQFPTIQRYTNDFEYMFVFSRGQITTFNALMVKTKTAGKKDNRYKISAFADQSADRSRNVITTRKETKRLTNTWGFGIGSSNKKHPAIFPDKLAQDHIYSWSNAGDIVLDPMCGSGTTCKAAVKLKRRYIGIDISPDYCAIAEQRIKVELSQPDLPFAKGGGE